MAKVAIVGGGISGLAAAYRLQELAPGYEITLFEAAGRLGGVLETVHEAGFQIEQSADNFITTFPWGVDLCRRLGLADRLLSTNPACRRTFVVRKGRLWPLPDGFLMMAPSRLWPLAITPLLSPWGKLRAALEYFIPARRAESDESMAAFVRRRLGHEVFERLVEPLVSAVYAADMEKLSVLATLPRFREMERKYGSLIRAMQAQRRLNPEATQESGARYSMFVTLPEGLSELVQSIARRLPANSIQLHTQVVAVEPRQGKWLLKVRRSSPVPMEKQRVSLPVQSSAELRPPAELPNAFGRENGQELPRSSDSQSNFGAAQRPWPEEFDGLILATPASVTAALIEPLEPMAAKLLASIRYEGTAILSLAYDRSQVGHPLNGMGCVVPAIERSPILAISFSSQKYVHRAPPDKVLLRVFAGGARQPELADGESEAVEDLLLPELERLLRISGKPQYRWFARWPRSMPQYEVGHRERIARIEQLIAAWPNLALAGNAYQGVGIPHCIHSGQQAAERLCEVLKKRQIPCG